MRKNAMIVRGADAQSQITNGGDGKRPTPTKRAQGLRTEAVPFGVLVVLSVVAVALALLGAFDHIQMTSEPKASSFRITVHV